MTESYQTLVANGNTLKANEKEASRLSHVWIYYGLPRSWAHWMVRYTSKNFIYEDTPLL